MHKVVEDTKETEGGNRVYLCEVGSPDSLAHPSPSIRWKWLNFVLALFSCVPIEVSKILNAKLSWLCYWKLTLQANKLHSRDCLPEPNMVQSFPPICGTGLSQKRLLSWTPPPQSASHGNHGDHMPYPPSTAQMNNNTKVKSSAA